MKGLLLLCAAVLLFAGQLFAQNRTVTGKVTDENGNPVPNASVSVKGSRLGTTTSQSGDFTISVPSNANALTVTTVGFATYEITLTASQSYNVSLKSSATDMNEVVVVAYGTAKKEAVTGSVGTIGAQQIVKRPLNNITGALEGAVSGVVTTSGSGQPGNGVAIRVRGFGSINASSDPLFVVDGVPYIGGTSNINPADVESITVLKDAASSALYGSRAANGVVIITTKKGQRGRNNVSVRIMQGVARRGLAEYDRVDAYQYYPLMWEAYRNSLIYPASGAPVPTAIANQLVTGTYGNRNAAGNQVYNGVQYPDISQNLGYNPFNVSRTSIVDVNGKINPSAQLLYPDDLDWTRDLARNGPRKDYNINFSGGSDKADYFMSVGYLNESGYTKQTDFERYSARLNVNINPKTWLRTGLNLSGNYTLSNTANDGSSTGFVNPFFFTRNIGPIYPVYLHNMTTGAVIVNEKNEPVWDLGNVGTSYLGIANGIPNRPSGAFAGRHALAEAVLNELYFRRSVVSARNYVDITFLKNFKFTNNVSVDIQNQSDNTFENTIVGDGAPGGRSRRQNGTSTGLVASQILNYGKTMGSHRLDVLVGHEVYNQMETDLNGFRQGQSLSGTTELTNFTTTNSLTSQLDRIRIESVFSRLNYDYKGKYMLTGSFRRDGNSRFAAQSRWGDFYAIGLGWRIDREKFFNSPEWLNLLKLRGSYGEVGVADGIGAYAYQGLYSNANNGANPGIVQNQTAYFNPDLTWETNLQSDIGVDFAMFDNRLNGSVELYNRRSIDLLFAVPQPLSSGALTATQNTATMYNKGIELQLNGDIVRTKNFIFNLNINLSTVKNRITKMPANVPEFINGTKKLTVGHSQYDYWLKTYWGVDPADGSALYVAANPATTAGRRVLVNKDGRSDTLTTVINNAKFEWQGSTIPDFYGSISPSVTFKQFTFNALLSFQKGGKSYDNNYAALMSPSYGAAIHEDVLKRWQKPGDITGVPRMDAARQADFAGQSSRWLVDASFINIRSMSLTYNLSKQLLDKWRISNSQVFVTAENLAFFSKRKGLNNQQAFTGVTSNVYPPARILSAGVSLNF